MEKGQFSIEFIIVLGVLIGLLGSVTMPLYKNSREDAQKLTDLSLAREAANKLAGAINNVYTAGVGCKQKVTYLLPNNISKIVISENIGSSENKVEVQIWSNNWGNDYITVETLLPTINHKNWLGCPLIEENLSISKGKHAIVVEHKKPDGESDNLLINVREI